MADHPKTFLYIGHGKVTRSTIQRFLRQNMKQSTPMASLEVQAACLAEVQARKFERLRAIDDRFKKQETSSRRRVFGMLKRRLKTWHSGVSGNGAEESP